MAYIEGTEKNDRLKGGSADDTILGFGGKDNIDGGAGSDLLGGGLGDDKIDGDAGDDSLTGDEGDDKLDGGVGSDSLLGGDGNDKLDGGAGDDSLLGAWNTFNFEYDTLRGGAGNDTLWGSVNTIVHGGAGVDHLMLDYNALDHGLKVDFSPLVSGGKIAVEGGQFDGIEVVSFFMGTAYDDFIVIGDNGDGIGSNNWIMLDGKDAVTGGAQSDSVSGGDGGDHLSGGGNFDVLSGDAGNDVLFGDGGADVLIGGTGTDYVDGGADDDILMGGADTDTLIGGSGADQFVFADGDFGGLDSLTADRVTDFDAGAGDLIVLIGVDAVAGGDDDAFQFVGNASFSGKAGELRYEVTGEATWIMGDTTGDSVADFVVILDGQHTLDMGSFIF